MFNLRSLPSVDRLLKLPEVQANIDLFGRPLVLQAVRVVLENIRASSSDGISLPDEEALIYRIQAMLGEWMVPSLLPVINATGVVLHTNLGRAPISTEALRAAVEVSGGYSNLEYDLATGKRGSRLVHAEALLTRLTSAESALVVNNNAAAVLLTLTALAYRRGVVISRTQLVEIGGGFRVPDVMKQSGAKLIEIGTTNRVHLSDYEQTLQDKPVAFLRAHRSNFRLVGFTTEPSLGEIVQVAHTAGIPVVDDLGSGTLLDTAKYGLLHEPTVQESLHSGADIVCFSGDKLLGGPQAGIILGKKELIGRLKSHPLARAVRADKIALAVLSATLLHYLKDEAEKKIPIWQMMSASMETLGERAQMWCRRLETRGIKVYVEPGLSAIGGGSLPEETLPTLLLVIETDNPMGFLKNLRSNNPPVIARVDQDRIVIDPRTVLIHQEGDLLLALEETFVKQEKKGKS